VKAPKRIGRSISHERKEENYRSFEQGGKTKTLYTTAKKNPLTKLEEREKERGTEKQTEHDIRRKQPTKQGKKEREIENRDLVHY